MTPEDEGNSINTNNCWIFTEEITNDKDKVRDHCLITGKYRGAAHKECNSKLRIPGKLPVIFHNLQGYDSHNLKILQIFTQFLNQLKNIWRLVLI